MFEKVPKVLTIDTQTGRNVIIVQPQGSLSESDIESLGDAIAEAGKTESRKPGLVIRLDHLPQWESFEALRAHMNLIMRHHADIPRIAVVTASAGLGFLPNIAGIFVQARMRHFAPKEQDEAIAWAGRDESAPEGFHILPGFPDNVIALSAVGEITSRDYTDHLIPLLREKEKSHDKLRLLMELGKEFENYTLGAIWDDAGLGLTYWRDFEKVALVTDSVWMTRAAKLFAPLMPGEVSVFPLAQMDHAKPWISA